MRSLQPGAVLVLFGVSAAVAVPAQADRSMPLAVGGSAIRPVAALVRDDEASCSRAGRRLWVEGEGWVVRRVTTCH